MGCFHCVRLRESRDSHIQRPICYHQFDVLLWWNLSVKNCISFSLTFLLQKYFQLINGLESVSFKTRQFIKIVIFLHNLYQLSISLESNRRLKWKKITKKIRHSNVIFVIQIFLRNIIWMGILNQFMKGRSHLNVTFVVLLLL